MEPNSTIGLKRTALHLILAVLPYEVGTHWFILWLVFSVVLYLITAHSCLPNYDILEQLLHCSAIMRHKQAYDMRYAWWSRGIFPYHRHYSAATSNALVLHGQGGSSLSSPSVNAVRLVVGSATKIEPRTRFGHA